MPLLFPACRPFVFSFADDDQKLVHPGRDHVDRIARERGLRGPRSRAWGFSHLGRLSASSAARFGEYPSGTLQG